MDQQKIGSFISSCRNEKGLTQAQLAEMLGVSDKSISRWENGRTMPDISLYEPLCQALGIQVSELLYARKMISLSSILRYRYLYSLCPSCFCSKSSFTFLYFMYNP